MITALITGLYVILAGIHLAGGWEDPLKNADPKTLGSVSARGGGKGGIVILAIKFWPYVLMGVGGYVVYNLSLFLWAIRKR